MGDILIETKIKRTKQSKRSMATRCGDANNKNVMSNMEIAIHLTPRSDGRLKIVDIRAEERFYSALQYGIINNVTMSELADRCYLSLSTFKRRFKQHLGCSPHEWFVTKRMEVAYDILSKANITISSLAKLCCYSNTSHFIEVFKSHYGVTPYMLRQKLTSENTNKL